jgi:hypothetical protein
MRQIAAVLLVMTFASYAWPQAQTSDDRDVDLFDQFLSDPRDGDTISETPVMDIESDSNGRLLVAYGNIDAYTGTAWVDVVVRQRNLTWQPLATISIDPPGGYGRGTKVKSVSVAIGNNLRGVNGDNYGFVTAVFEQDGVDWVTYHSGSLKAPWRSMRPGDLVITGWRALPVTDPLFVNATIGVLPTRPSNFAEYIVAIAVATPSANPNDALIQLIWMDFFSPGYWGPEIYNLAGQGGKVMSGRFGRPHLTIDDVNGRWGVAFEDLSEPRVHVISGGSGTEPSAISLIYSTPSTRTRHHPIIRAHRGQVNLTTLGRAIDQDDQWELFVYNGVISSANNFLEVMLVDDNCKTPGDLDIKRDDVFIAARCYDDAGRQYRITSFELKRASGPLLTTRIEDRLSFSTRQPRIGVAPPGAGIVYAAVGFATDGKFPIPGGVSGADAVMLDP